MKRILFAFILSMAASPVFSACDDALPLSEVKGYVFEDKDGNGKMDGQEKGIPGVPVSNGRDVVLTDNDGKYVLPSDNDDIIFVIKPSGYRTAVDESNFPRFYYIHKPAGSPAALKYAGTTPTGELPESVDFPLYGYDEPEKFDVMVFGDSQLNLPENALHFEKGIIEEASQVPGISFGITLGDLVNNKLDLTPLYKSAVSKMGIPWYNVMGNHDMNMESDSLLRNDILSDETFESHFGPNTFSYNYGKVHFIHLDDILFPDITDGVGYCFGLRDDQLEFVENDLRYVSPDHLIVIAAHIPMLPASKSPSAKRLADLLSAYPDVLMLSAHTHVQYQAFEGRKEGLDREKPIHEYNVGTSCGDWYSGPLDENGVPVSTMHDGTPKGYAVLHFDGNSYTADYKVAGKPADYQISLYLPKVVSSTRPSYYFYANFFMGRESDILEYRVDDGKWRKMNNTLDYDPSYYRYAQDWDYTDTIIPGRRPSKPVDCRHLWFQKLPSGIAAGEHTLEVRVTDMYGKTHTAKGTYTVK